MLCANQKVVGLVLNIKKYSTRHHVYIIDSIYHLWWGFPGGSVVKNLPTMQEPQGISLCQEDPLEKGMATHSSILAMDIGVWWATLYRATELDKTEAT